MLAIPLMFTSCEEDLAEMNINPHTSQILSYDAQFLFVQDCEHSTSSANCLASPIAIGALTGLSPIGRQRLANGDAFGTLNFMSYIHHSRRTQTVVAHR